MSDIQLLIEVGSSTVKGRDGQVWAPEGLYKRLLENFKCEEMEMPHTRLHQQNQMTRKKMAQANTQRLYYDLVYFLTTQCHETSLMYVYPYHALFCTLNITEKRTIIAHASVVDITNLQF